MVKKNVHYYARNEGVGLLTCTSPLCQVLRLLSAGSAATAAQSAVASFPHGFLSPVQWLSQIGSHTPRQRVPNSLKKKKKNHVTYSLTYSLDKISAGNLNLIVSFAQRINIDNEKKHGRDLFFR